MRATSNPVAVYSSPVWWTPVLQRVILDSRRLTPPPPQWTTCLHPPHRRSSGRGRPSVVCMKIFHLKADSKHLQRFYPDVCLTDSLLGSDEDGSSEVFLPTDSDYDSSDALSPRELDLLYSPASDLSQQVLNSLGGSAPDVLQIHELR